MIPENFIYFSLNLTESSVNKLSDFISKHYLFKKLLKEEK